MVPAQEGEGAPMTRVTNGNTISLIGTPGPQGGLHSMGKELNSLQGPLE